MPYTPQTWTDGVSKLNATRMTVIETGIDDATTTADAAIPSPASPSTNDGLFYNGSAWVADTIDNAKIDAAAAIAYSKLNLTGAIVNADISSSAAIDLSKLASAAWTSFTPVWTAATTNPVLGNGTITGRYIQIGKIVFYSIIVTAGSTTTFGTGTYALSLPVTALSQPNMTMGMGNVLDTGTSNYSAMAVQSTTTKINLALTSNASGAVWTPTAPFTLANGDKSLVSGMYEAA